MPNPDRDAVLTALRTVTDPQSGKDIVSAGIVQTIKVTEKGLQVLLEVSPATTPDQAETLRLATETALNPVEGAGTPAVLITAERAMGSGKGPSGSPAKSAPHPAQSRPSGGSLALPGVKHIIAVASGKGGVGKSTVAVNLALGLHQQGLRVGLLDADIYGPSIPRMLGLTEKPETQGKKLRPLEAFGLKAMSIGLLVDTDTPMIWRGPMVVSALTQMLSDVDWGDLDVLVVDMPPGTGDAQLTMAQRVPLSGAVIVSTPQEIALIDARKGLAMFEKTHVPVFGMVENMAWFEDPTSGARTYIFGQGGARRTADTLGCAFLGEIPLYPAIRAQSDDGVPIVAAQPGSPEAAPFHAIAEAVAEKLGAPRRDAPKIVIE